MKKLLTNKKLRSATKAATALGLAFCLSGQMLLASSHAEAPLISMDRYADNTDTYAFRSIEPGRDGFVTLIANYIPFQDPSGGPQYYRFDDTVLYEIKIDNTGDGLEDVKYQFRFQTQVVNPNTVLGHTAVNQDAVVSSLTDPDYNMPQTYSVTRVDITPAATNAAPVTTIRRDRRGRILGIPIPSVSQTPAGPGMRESVVAQGLRMPPSNVGPKVTPNYEANLGSRAIYPLPNGGRVFAGQRDEGFIVDVGGVFDALNLRSIGQSGGVSTTDQFNVNSIAIEVPIAEVVRGNAVPASSTSPNAVIGVWATASRQSTQVLGAGTRTGQGEFQQISRLGNPLVNELVIPLGLKDAFNSLSPVNDAVAAPAILDPELARLLRAVFGINIPPPPRNDLVAIFATGIPAGAVPGLPAYTTFLSDGQPHEYLRLNVAIPPTPFANINRFGLLGGDVAGFPNGRRVMDDVVDIELRAVAGGTPFTPATNVAPNNALGDGVSGNDRSIDPITGNEVAGGADYLQRFPYLAPPHQGNQPRRSNQR